MKKVSKKILAIGIIASSLAFTQSAFAATVNESEPSNNNYYSPTSFNIGDSATGFISDVDDSDWWSFSTNATQNGQTVSVVLSDPQNKNYQFTVLENGSSSPANYQSGGQSNGTFTASFTLSASSTYKIVVYGVGANDHTYGSTSTSDRYYLSVN